MSRARVSNSVRVGPEGCALTISGLGMDASVGIQDKRPLWPCKLCRPAGLSGAKNEDHRMRPSDRSADTLREVTLETGVNRYAEGSCLVTFGHTKVLVTASLEEGVPPFLRGRGQGWVTAEYGMLPRATHTRGRREAAQG